MRVVVGQLRRGRMPRNYATVMTRQSVADLTSVVTDLRQVTAPSADLARDQQRLQRLLIRTIPVIGSVTRDWDQPARLARTAIRLSAAAHRLARLTPALA